VRSDGVGREKGVRSDGVGREKGVRSDCVGREKGVRSDCVGREKGVRSDGVGREKGVRIKKRSRISLGRCFLGYIPATRQHHAGYNTEGMALAPRLQLCCKVHPQSRFLGPLLLCVTTKMQ
jgi:hypothetical protein